MTGSKNYLKRKFDGLKNFLSNEEWSDDSDTRIIIFAGDEIKGNSLDVPIPLAWLEKNGWKPGAPLELKRARAGIVIRTSQKYDGLEKQVREMMADDLAVRFSPKGD